MPIEVEIPGVGIAEFPDGTPHDVIERVLREQAPQPKQGFLARTFNPQREDFPEFPTRFDSPQQALETVQGMGDTSAALGQDRFGNQTIRTQKGEFYLNRPGLSVNDITGLLAGAEGMAKDVAPFLAGGAAAAPLKALPAMGIQAGIGAGSETINQTGRAMLGEDVQWGKLATTPLLAAGGEGLARGAFHVLRPVFNRLLGSRAPSNLIKADGTLSDDALKALQGAKVAPAQLDDLTQRELVRAVDDGRLSLDEAERFNFFTRQGLSPTKAQVTRSADDFMLQQEAAKRSTGVREALEQQEAKIAEAFDLRIRGTGGSGVSSGSPVADAVLNKASMLDQEISSLYKAARDAAPEDKFVRPERLINTLKQYAPDNQLSGGVIRSIHGDLKARGVIGDRFATKGRVDVNTAEEIRKTLNSLHGSTNDRGRMIIRELKDALDDDVMAAAGQDFFQQARSAKASFEKGLSRTKLSKFDMNNKSLVRDVLENKISPDDLFDRAVIGKSWKAPDLRELKGYLTQGTPEQVAMGRQAWDDLRAETLQYLKNTSFIGPEDAQGIKALSRDKLEKGLARIGDKRLEVLFSQEERTFLNDMLRLSKWREPVRGTQQGKGPSAQAIAALQDKVMASLEKLPFGFGEIAQALRAHTAAMEALANPASQTIGRAQQAAIKGAVTTPGAAAGVALEDRLTRGM